MEAYLLYAVSTECKLFPKVEPAGYQVNAGWMLLVDLILPLSDIVCEPNGCDFIYPQLFTEL